jgi:hypothetical protein
VEDIPVNITEGTIIKTLHEFEEEEKLLVQKKQDEI